MTVAVAWDGARASAQARPLRFEFGTSVLNRQY